MWEDQIVRHIDSISNDPGAAGTRLLVGLTREPSPEALNARLVKKAMDKRVIFIGLTYAKIIEDLRQTCERHDENLNRILDDYEDFLAHDGLLDNRDQRLVVFLCGTSLDENIKYGLYYEPSSRSCRSGAGYVGVYKNKRVHAVGRLEAIAVISFTSGNISSVANEFGSITQEHLERIKAVVAATDYYDLGNEDLRVYLVDRFYPTEITKMSPGGARGTRYLNLMDLAPNLRAISGRETSSVADGLRGATFT